MRVAYLECFSGISGDMFLGALVDAGVPARLFEETVAALDIGARLEISRVQRNGISASKVDVYANGEKELPREVYWEQRKAESKHSHHSPAEDRKTQQRPIELLEHNFAVSSSHDETPQEPKPDHDHSRKHGRGLGEIRAIIEKADISNTAKQTALRIFETLGAAEAKIHNTTIDEVHFHEVGAVDAMVDIVCAAVGAEALGVDEIVCSPLNVGGGTVECAHGTLPVPAPATLELLKSAPIYSSGPQVELVTPTGAAIVAALAKRFAPFPAMTITGSGYGAGTRDFPAHANVLRLTIGEADRQVLAGTKQETITILEANVDDLNPQVFAYVVDRLIEQGALDTFGQPIQMKKGRPGMLLTVLCQNEDASKLAELILQETSTLGVRHRQEVRDILAREWNTVTTQWGEVRIKIGRMNEKIVNAAPEFEDCKRLALEHKVPLKTVMQEAMLAYSMDNTATSNQPHMRKKSVTRISS